MATSKQLDNQKLLVEKMKLTEHLTFGEKLEALE